MPSGPQPCSSSPIRMRFGSADSVVLPVPDRPKNSALSPSWLTLAEQCIGTTFSRRQIEVERGEHRLLHLAGVGRAADQHDLAGEIDRHHGVGAFAAAVTLGVGLERRQIDDGEFGHEAGELGALGTDQQLADEQRMPGQFGEDAGLDLVFRIGAAVEILREQFLAFARAPGSRPAARRSSQLVILRLPSHHTEFSVSASTTVCLSLGERPV